MSVPSQGAARRRLPWILTSLLCLGLVQQSVADDESEDFKSDKPLSEIAPGYMRAPYLQSLGTDTVVIAWVAADPGEPAVDYGLTPEYGYTVVATSADDHRAATLQHLEPGTTYHYRVRAGDRILASGETLQFRTDAGREDARFSFFVTGDIGSKSGRQVITSDAILRAATPVDLGILCGDVIYRKGHSDSYDRRLMRPWQDIFSQMCVWPALGNHDWKSDPEKNWEKEWVLPNNEHYYSFDYGSAHFIALDTRDGDLYDRDNQVRWLEGDLAAHRDAAWTFVYFHHPGVTCTYKRYNKAVIENFLPVFDRYGVDVVFSGHAHTYERTYPLLDGKKVSEDMDPHYVDPQGTIYIVSGAGAKPKSGEPTRHCGPTAFFRDETLLWTQVFVDGELCTIRSWNSRTDELVDEVTIRKSGLSG